MKIGIAISGGGYRATSYGLGTLSYLHHLQLQGEPLIKNIVSMSTVSGGSITGITYSQWAKAGLSFEDYFKWLYLQITEFDLITESIDNYVKDSKKNSLIEGFSSSYAKNLLLHSKFWSIQPNEKSHLKYYSINATDFNTGSPFRFIAQPKSKGSDNITDKTNEAQNKKTFFMGNGFFNLTENHHSIPLNVALAASSCFPGGFEPIILKLYGHVKDLSKKPYKEVSLMDGGIVDNQGIEALLKFNEKIPLDLIIVVDSASPSINDYKQSKVSHIPIIGNMSLKKINKVVATALLFNSIFVVLSFCFNNIFTLISTISLTLLAILFFTLKKAKKSFHIALKKNNLNTSNFEPLGHLTPNSIVQLINNRVSSGSLLIGTVFLKHIRRLNTKALFSSSGLGRKTLYNSLYQFKLLNKKEEFLKLNNSQIDEFSLFVKSSLLGIYQNFNIRHVNEINQLKDESEKLNKIKYLLNSGLYNSLLKQHNTDVSNRFGKIVKISERAFKMDTTLWVSRDKVGKELVRDVIVMGQISTCCNIWNSNYLNDKYPEVVMQAKSDWEKFKNNPYWLFDEMQKNENDVMEIFRNKQKELKKEYDDIFNNDKK